MSDAPNTVDVLLTGNTLPGTDIDQAAAAFAGLMRISPEQARALITGGKSKLLRRGLSPEKGLAATSRLASLGIEAVMRPSAPAKAPARETPHEPPAEAQPAQPVPPPQPPKPELPPTYTNSIGMEFVLIPAGSFLMGSPECVGRPEERPQHQVNITRPFYLCKFQVTQAQWQAIKGSNPSKFKGPTNPVERVSWSDAKQFIAGLNAKEGHNLYRLPTEAEWEYACRAGTETAYYFGCDGNQLGQRYAWCGGNSGSKTHPVGQKEPNPWGLYDIYGNVWEWVEDWYNEQIYSASPPENPTGPVTGKERVRRGGSCTATWGCCSSRRYYAKPNTREIDIGFRLAMTADANVQTSIGEQPKATPVSAQVAPAPAGSNVQPAPVATTPKAEASQPQPATPPLPAAQPAPAATASVPPAPTAAATPGAAPAATGPTAYVPPGGEPMTFGKAVSTCFKKYVDFSGRASRAEFCFFFLFNFLVGFSVAFILSFAGADEHTIDVASKVSVLVLLLPSCAVGARRLHDTDMSGWWQLLGVIPIIGIVIVFVLCSREGTPGPNRYGEAPPGTNASKGLITVLLIAVGILVAIPIIGIVAAIAIPQFANYKMRSYNSIAQADLLNARAAQERLYEDYQVYGASREGTWPPDSRVDSGEMLTGPLSDASQSSNNGAMLIGNLPDGRISFIGISVADKVSLLANGGFDKSGEAYYIIAAKHTASNRILVTYSGEKTVFYCENPAWVNKDSAGGVRAPDGVAAGKECGGSPVSTWQAW